MSFEELLELKDSLKKDSRFFFVTDEELNEIEELLTTLENGEKVYDPVVLSSKASLLGYWCEADYTEESGGYIFEKL